MAPQNFNGGSSATLSVHGRLNTIYFLYDLDTQDGTINKTCISQSILSLLPNTIICHT